MAFGQLRSVRCDLDSLVQDGIRCLGVIQRAHIGQRLKSTRRTARIFAREPLGVDGIALGAALVEVQRDVALAAKLRERVDVALQRDEVRDCARRALRARAR